MKTIEIIVKGNYKSGKSTIIELIAKAFADEGILFNVSELEFNEIINPNFMANRNKRLENIKNNISVNIKSINYSLKVKE